MGGTAPEVEVFLLVEAPGPWGAKALTDNRLPEAVRRHLAELSGVTVHLIRRPGTHAATSASAATRVFLARRAGTGFTVTASVLSSPEALLTLDLDDDAVWVPYEQPLWLVCTNGKRDLCCAEQGRPVVTTLDDRWPGQAWEVTHLGGHRFSATLLALPSGLVLGRLTPQTAVAACEAVQAGDVPVDVCRGRADRSGSEQVRELHLAAGGDVDVEVVAHIGPLRRQSCGDAPSKPTVRYEVRPLGR